MSAGLSWKLMLQKREIFRACFVDFDYNKVAWFTDSDINAAMEHQGMIRSRRKIEAIVTNAQTFIRIIEEFGSFETYLWKYTNGQTYIYHRHLDGEWITNNQSIKDRIVVEDIPSGRLFLPAILEALKEETLLRITYQGFWKNEAFTFNVEPYCVKLFRQRWYLVARSIYYDKVMIYAVDRMSEVHKTSTPFNYPKDFSPEEFFHGCFGVIAGDGTKIERVELQVTAGQANYLRSLRLHQSQIESYRGDEYSIFEYQIRPTFDFQLEILAHTPDIEVLSPTWLREEIAGKIAYMNKKYRSTK